MSKIHLGDLVRDPISGFQGVVTARTEWLYGCIRISVAPEKLDKDGKVQDAQWFDEPQLEFLGTGSYTRHTKKPKKSGKKFMAPNGSIVTGGPARETDPGR